MSPVSSGAPHVPVLLDEVVVALAPAPGETIVDATFGAGGYTRALLAGGARVIAFDRDPDAIAAGRAAAPDGLTLVHADFYEHPGRSGSCRSFCAGKVSVRIFLKEVQLDLCCFFLCDRVCCKYPAGVAFNA